jgi:putative membrane protein
MMSTVLLAQDHWNGPGPWWPIFPLLWLALLVTVFVLILRRRRDAGSSAGESRLAERYAAGEIDASEYRERLAVLNNNKKK